jgi:hypothetical protein
MQFDALPLNAPAVRNECKNSPFAKAVARSQRLAAPEQSPLERRHWSASKNLLK